MKRSFWSLLAGLLLFPSMALALSQSAVPAKFPLPWASAASVPYIRTIPTPSQIGIQNCAASLTDGFPPLTFAIPSAGGCPPFGADFNGILQQITQWSRWQAAGGPILYDSGFSSSIGGYPKGAWVGSLTTPGLIWISTTDNNTSNPDTGGAGWSNAMTTGVGNLGGALSGTLPNPSIANSVNLPGSPTTTTQALGDATAKIATTLFANPGSSLGTTGYQQLPSGLIIQWGSYASTLNPQTVIFPIAFPNTPLVAFASEWNGAGWGNYPNISAPSNTSWTKTQRVVYTDHWNGSGWVPAIGPGVFWFAIGF